MELGAYAPPLTPASPSHQVVNQMLDRTRSGTFAGNDGFTYLTLTSLPFGGVGEPRPPSPSSPNSQGSPGGRSRPRKVQFGLHSRFNLDPVPWSLRTSVSLSAKWLFAWPGFPWAPCWVVGCCCWWWRAPRPRLRPSLPCPCRPKWDGKIPWQVLFRHLLPPPCLPALPPGPGDAEQHPLPTLF